MWYGYDCHDENYDNYHDRHGNDDDFVELYNDYKQYKAQKKQIDKELLVTMVPFLIMELCITQDEKKETEKSWKR